MGLFCSRESGEQSAPCEVLSCTCPALSRLPVLVLNYLLRERIMDPRLYQMESSLRVSAGILTTLNLDAVRITFLRREVQPANAADITGLCRSPVADEAKESLSVEIAIYVSVVC